MKWTYSIQQKTTAAVLLAAIFVAIFIVNRIENNKVNELGTSMNSVYEDRLMVENYIFRLSGLLYEKKILLDQCSGMENNADNSGYLAIQNNAIGRLVSDYECTELTELEAQLFTQLKTQIDAIQSQERLFLEAGAHSTSLESTGLNASFQSANHLLNDLSNVQLSVGKSVNERSQQLVAGTNLLTHFELAMLVIIGLLIHALIFSSRSVAKKVCKNPSLN